MDDATGAILGIARDVLGDLDTELVLARVLAAARELTGARYAALGVLDESGRGLTHFEALGVDAATRRRIASPPGGHGVLGELIRDPAPLRLADVASDPRAYGFPYGHPPMRTFLGVPILVDGEPLGSLYLADRVDGAQFDEADEEAVAVLAELAGVAIGHARRLAAAEARQGELQRTVDALAATIRIAEALGGHTNAAEILDLVCERGRELVAARSLLIEVERDGALEVAAGSGELAASLVGRRLPLGQTVASVALSTRRTLRLSAAPNRTRFERHGLGAQGVQAHDGLIVPMVFHNETFGVLVALDPVDGDGFTAEHQQLLESFAASAASALSTARLATLERRRQSLSAAERERSRWARELHDETLQGLASLRLLLAAAQRKGDEATRSSAIEQALDQLDLDIAGLRSLIAELRPPALDELGIEPALRALAERFDRAGLHVEVSIDLDEPARPGARHPPELETAIYRIVHEALTNAATHGHARDAVVEIAAAGDAVRVSVRDDGEGFDPAAAASGFGLPGMRERAELLGGTVAVASARGGPTTITATLTPERSADP